MPIGTIWSQHNKKSVPVGGTPETVRRNNPPFFLGLSEIFKKTLKTKNSPASAATLAGDSDQSITKTDEVIMNDFSRSFILYHFTPDFTS